MAIQSRVNQYLGINPHLHSFWQGTGRWNRFHNFHVGQLMAALKAQLLPLGYTAEIEESLQVRRVGDDLPRRPRSDILIRDLDLQRAASSGVSNGVQTIALGELVEEEEDLDHPYSAIGLYERTPDFQPGEPVGWVELLSPTNKGDTKDAYTYLAKRRLMMEQGLVFVEIDYLHETSPTFERLPDYSRREDGAHPYRIAIMDPRPEYHWTQVNLQELDVDTPVPKMEIPLNRGDKLAFDFGVVYRKTFEEALYGYDMDYTELPQNFDRYSTDDQQRIERRMAAVAHAFERGDDLEQGPFPASGSQME
jgi:uncharacterized protein DUF4058